MLVYQRVNSIPLNHLTSYPPFASMISNHSFKSIIFPLRPSFIWGFYQKILNHPTHPFGWFFSCRSPSSYKSAYSAFSITCFDDFPATKISRKKHRSKLSHWSIVQLQVIQDHLQETFHGCQVQRRCVTVLGLGIFVAPCGQQQPHHLRLPAPCSQVQGGHAVLGGWWAGGMIGSRGCGKSMGNSWEIPEILPDRTCRSGLHMFTMDKLHGGLWSSQH